MGNSYFSSISKDGVQSIMAFNVDQFRDHFAKHNDFAKTSKFDVRITAPSGLGLDATDLRFQCETTELPGYNINTVDGRYYGVANPVASFPSFAELTLTFVCAGDFWEKKLFDRWMNIVIPFNNYNPRYKIDYTAPKIVINQFAEFGGGEQEGSAPIIYSVSFFEAFPTAMAPMNMNWADDGIHRLPVTFRYEYWTTSDLEISGGELLEEVQVTGIRRNVPASLPASGSTPPRVGTQPTNAAPRKSDFRGKGGTFAGGGATGGWG